MPIIKKSYKLFLFFLLFIIIICSSVVFIAPYYINTDIFRYNIVNYLEKTIKKDVNINGDINIRLFPWIGFEIHEVIISDEVQYGKKPLLEFEEADVEIELMPVFKKEIVFKKILFKKLKLKLVKNEQGNTNWNEILKWYAGTGDVNENSNNFSLLDFGHISIRDSSIFFNDKTNNIIVQLNNVNFDRKGSVNHIFSLHFDIYEFVCPYIKTGNLTGRAKIRGLSTFKPDEKIFKINQSILNISYKYDDYKKIIQGDFSGNAVYDFILGKLDINFENCNVKGLSLNGKINAKNLYKTPQISGNANIHSDDINNFFTGLNLKPLASGQTDGNLSFKTNGLKNDELLNNLSFTINLNINLLSLIYNLEPIKKYIDDITIDKTNIQIIVKKILNGKRDIYYDYELKGFAKTFNKETEISSISNGKIEAFQNLNDFKILDCQVNIETKFLEYPYEKIALNCFMDLDTKNEHINFEKISINGLNILAKARLDINNFYQNQAAKGYLDIKDFSPRQLLSSIGHELKLKPDCKLYNLFKIKTNFEINDNNLNLSKLNLTLDETNLKGFLKINNLNNPAISFNFNVSEADLDKYLASYYYMCKNDNYNKENQNTQKHSINNYYYNGKLKFNKYKLYNVKFDNMNMDVKGTNGIFNINHFSGDSCTGKISGEIKIDYRSKPMTTIIKSNMKNILIEQFFKDFFYWEKTISGKSDIDFWISGKGRKWNDFITSLNGRNDFVIRNGAIHGITIIPNIIKKQLIKTDPNQKIEEIPKLEKFTNIDGRIIIKDGILSTDNMNMTAEYLKAEGNGYVDYPNGYVDYYAKVKISKFPLIPYKIKGPFNNIDYSLDRSAFVSEAVQNLFKHAEGVSSKTIKKTFKIGKEALKDTIDAGGKAFDVDTKSITESLDKGSNAINKTFDKSSNAIKKTIHNSSEKIKKTFKAKKEAIGNGLKNLFKRKNNNDNQDKSVDHYNEDINKLD